LEQNDNEDMQDATTPSPESTADLCLEVEEGPLKNRYFQLTDILDNNLSPTWEVIPQVGRNLSLL
jgi:hypothetical protein